MPAYTNGSHRCIPEGYSSAVDALILEKNLLSLLLKKVHFLKMAIVAGVFFLLSVAFTAAMASIVTISSTSVSVGSIVSRVFADGKLTCTVTKGSVDPTPTLDHYTFKTLPCDGQEYTARLNTGSTITLSNYSTVETTVSIYFVPDDGTSPLTLSITADPAYICSAQVNNYIVFENINVGDAPDMQLATVSDSASSTELTFTPSTFNSNGGTLGNNSELTYSVSGAEWNLANSNWTGKSSEYRLKLNEISRDVLPGSYSGTLVVTMSCL